VQFAALIVGEIGPLSMAEALSLTAYILIPDTLFWARHRLCSGLIPDQARPPNDEIYAMIP